MRSTAREERVLAGGGGKRILGEEKEQTIVFEGENFEEA
jgi:hypothetical protein